MSARSATEHPPHPKRSGPDDVGRDKTAQVIVCVETGHDSRAMIGHAKAIAKAFDAEVVLVSVIETRAAESKAVDPLDWEIRRREVSAHLGDLAREFATRDCRMEVMVLEGQPDEQICNCAAKSAQDVIVVSRCPGGDHWRTSRIARGAMASDFGAILMVPGDAPTMEAPGYGRVFVPLDGSSLAESALSKAARLASACGSDLVLCHVTPEPVLTEVGPVDPEIVTLKERIAQRNRRVGQSYLDRVRDGLKYAGVRVSTRLVVGGDARRLLVATIAEENADIVVMASHGKSAHADVPVGEVADFVLDRSLVPVLIVRQADKRQDSHIFRNVRSEDVRHPADMVK